jgi:hypothetical protein
LGLAQHFLKQMRKRLNSGRILSRAQNWAEKQAQLSEKILLRPKILTLSVSNPGAKHPQKATFGHG